MKDISMKRRRSISGPHTHSHARAVHKLEKKKRRATFATLGQSLLSRPVADRNFRRAFVDFAAWLSSSHGPRRC